MIVFKKKMTGFFNILSLKDAINSIFKKKIAINSETVNIKDAIGRVTSDPVIAPYNIPEFDRSAVDGFAVIAENTYSASQTNPIFLDIIDSVEAGESKPIFISDGKAVKIFTGAKIPGNANAVIMVEDVEVEKNQVKIYKQVRAYENVSTMGEDLKKGEVIINSSKLIKAQHIGAFSAVGLKQIDVYKRVRIGILSTGTELVRGSVKNSTQPLLIALLSRSYTECLDLGVVQDDYGIIKDRLIESLKNCDVLVVTGGTSLGEKDFVPDIVSELGKLSFSGVAIRPAKTTAFGTINNISVFMVSGFPVAAMVSAETFIIPYVRECLNLKQELYNTITGTLTHRIANNVGVTSFVRVKITKVSDRYMIDPLRVTGSGIISSVTKANGILLIPPDKEGYDEGAEVTVRIIDDIEVE